LSGTNAKLIRLRPKEQLKRIGNLVSFLEIMAITALPEAGKKFPVAEEP
jgi:hypothetical protein